MFFSFVSLESVCFPPLKLAILLCFVIWSLGGSVSETDRSSLQTRSLEATSTCCILSSPSSCALGLFRRRRARGDSYIHVLNRRFIRSVLQKKDCYWGNGDESLQT
jgi:hypothetical protein